MKIIDLDQLPSDKLEAIEEILTDIDKKECPIYDSYEGFIRKFLDVTKQYDEYGNLKKTLDDDLSPIDVDGKIKIFDDDIKYGLNTNHKSHIDEDTKNLIAVKESGVLEIFKKMKEKSKVYYKEVSNTKETPKIKETVKSKLKEKKHNK